MKNRARITLLAAIAAMALAVAFSAIYRLGYRHGSEVARREFACNNESRRLTTEEAFRRLRGRIELRAPRNKNYVSATVLDPIKQTAVLKE